MLLVPVDREARLVVLLVPVDREGSVAPVHMPVHVPACLLVPVCPCAKAYSARSHWLLL